MNCKQFQNILEDYIDNNLTTIQSSQVQSHLTECEQCQKSYTEANDFQSLLKNLPIAPARQGYEKRVLSFLEEKPAKQIQRHSWLYLGFSGAIAASFSLWLIFSPLSLFSPHSSMTDKMNTINLFVQKQQTVDLIFNLANELPGATLTIELPEKIKLSGYTGKRQLSWKTTLKKGANRLALPIIGTQEHSGILIARLTNNGKTKTFRVRINTKKAPTSLFMLTNPTVINT